MVKFVVPGDIVGKGRPRFARYGKSVHAYTPPKTATYESMIRWHYASECKNYRFEDKDMLKVIIKAYYRIPNSDTKKNKELKAKGVLRPIKKPDIDNVTKIVLDALNEVAFKDDTQIVDCYVSKYYSNEPRLEVSFEKVEESDGHTDDGIGNNRKD